MKNQIKQNLEKLFNQKFELINATTFKGLIDATIENNPEVYSMNSESMGLLFDEDDIKRLSDAKENTALETLFDSVKERLQHPEGVVADFKKDIIRSIEVISQKVRMENKGYENQVILLEHGYDAHAYFCGFGEGDYPIFKAPEYLKSDFEQELFNGEGNIDYSGFWNKLIEFEELVEALELDDIFWNTEIFQVFKDAYRFKTCQLLFEAFEQIPLEAYEGIPIKLPLFIYQNEHDSEVMNVYVYE